jgi:hypothetical protein
MERPYIWQMISEAILALNGRATYSEIKNYINSKWDDVKDATINAQITVLTVNQPSRIHYPENKKARISNTKYDLLYTIGRGEVVAYSLEEHGLWEIYLNEFGAQSIRQIVDEDTGEEELEATSDSFLFPLEANLRDFLIRNLGTVKGRNLKLFVDENGRDGKEYLAGKIGFIDILTVDEHDNFIVFELKLSNGPDRALGQLLRYMGWVKANLAADKKVEGIIVASKMDDKIKYAVTMVPEVSLYEYVMNFELNIPLKLAL